MAFQRQKPAAIGIKAPFPGFIEPALTTSIEKVTGGERWLTGGERVGRRFGSVSWAALNVGEIAVAKIDLGH